MRNTLILEWLQLRELPDYSESGFLLEHNYSMEEMKEMVWNILD